MGPVFILFGMKFAGVRSNGQGRDRERRVLRVWNPRKTSILIFGNVNLILNKLN